MSKKTIKTGPKEITAEHIENLNLSAFIKTMPKTGRFSIDQPVLENTEIVLEILRRLQKGETPVRIASVFDRDLKINSTTVNNFRRDNAKALKQFGIEHKSKPKMRK